MTGFTDKQIEYLNKANHRWNIKHGATRSGKTYLDYYIIPKRIRRIRDKDGLIVLLGNTKGTLQRNIIEPLQKIWGTQLVSDIKSDNTAFMFGEKVHCLGADKISQVDKLRGSSIKYCYGDEVVTWSSDVFEMLKSRLDKTYSKFDGTCNPENPKHWVKSFIDSDVDIFAQNYTVYDNPYLPDEVKRNLEKEYAGTVFFDRYILGKWAVAEGLIYKKFSNNPKAFAIKRDDIPTYKYVEKHKDAYPICEYNIGVDFGGNKSGHAFVFSGITSNNKLYALKSCYIDAKGVDSDEFVFRFTTFADECKKDYGRIDAVYCDSAEQTLINTLRNKTNYNIYNSIKNPIIDRIRAMSLLIGSNRFYYVEDDNDALVDGLITAVWDSKKMTDTRLDDGTSNIDILDAFEYSWEYNIYRLVGDI